ncbi:MAG: hypothetical protein DRN15_07105 [Thermoprotei archaeon]|nr:MAG: hypothetical protein DRN15_07105 [Thermoprotei archaeon]
MQVTTEHILWIVAGLGVAGLVIFSLFSWMPRFMTTKDFTAYDVHCYYDGRYVHVFATIKNTGNVPIKQIRIDLTVGGSATVNLNLKGGEQGAINDVKIAKAGLRVGQVIGVKLTAIFQDNSQKARLVHVVLEEW